MADDDYQDLNRAMNYVTSGDSEKAREICSKILEKNPVNAPANHILGLIAYMANDYQAAMTSFSLAVQFDERNPLYHGNLGECQRRSGKLDEALATFERAVVLMPEFLKSHLGVGNTLRDMKRYEEAVSKFRIILAINPGFAPAYHYLGLTYVDEGKLDDALPLLRKAIGLNPKYNEAKMSLAQALEEAEEAEEALALYIHILEDNPDNPGLHNNIGNILKNLGRMDESVEHYKKALGKDSGSASVLYNLSRTQLGSSDEDITHMQTLIEDENLDKGQRRSLLFALGKIYDDLGRYPEAFDLFQEANDLDDRGEAFDAVKNTAVIERIISLFNRPFFGHRQNFGSESELPVFIVGMPRSGTTLVEQTLASHPQVYGAGELSQMAKIITSIGGDQNKAANILQKAALLDPITACRHGEDYLSYLKMVGGGALRVTDKMPSNFMFLGFVALLLPRARIIHCRRDPLDTCLSCYFQHFTQILPFSKKLSDLGSYYFEYSRLMAHWRKVMPLSMLEINYHDMVADHEGSSRKIIEFCGLEWDDRCLDFHNTDRTVKTASSWQVRQPIYSSSLQRWRNYDKHLAPLRESLGDIA